MQPRRVSQHKLNRSSNRGQLVIPWSLLISKCFLDLSADGAFGESGACSVLLQFANLRRTKLEFSGSEFKFIGKRNIGNAGIIGVERHADLFVEELLEGMHL